MVFRQFCLALGFLTHIPSPIKSENYPDKDLGYSVLTYPVVGALIGLILLAVYYFLPTHHADLDAALLLVLWTFLTGGLHIDGLSDSADAWVGGHHDRDKALEIMRDSSCGPMGVMAVVSVLLLKFVAIKSLIVSHAIMMPLILVPMISRTAVIGLLLTTKYQQSDELGARLQKHLPKWPAIVLISILSIMLILFSGRVGMKMLLITIIGSYLLRRLMQQRIGGMTGDTAGAFIEIIEMGILLGLAL